MDCFVFGAGASKCYSESPTEQKMPLANEFFKVFHELSISSNPWVLIGDVINYIRENFGVSPLEFLDFNEDIERIHSEIHEKFLEAQSRKDLFQMIKYGKADTQLAFMFTSVINEIQNGPVSQAHVNFVKTLKKDDSIVTFNWDTLLDRALSVASPWSTDRGYAIIPKKIYRNRWVDANERKCDCELIKLHGSTNWITSYPIVAQEKLSFTHATGDNNVFVYENTIDPYPCYDGRYMYNYKAFSYGYYPPNLFVDAKKPTDGYVVVRHKIRNSLNPKGDAYSDGIVSMPLIITPVRKKEYDRFGDLFESLWNSAEEQLRISQRIFVIGYSFPKTDTRTTDLFISAFSKRNEIPEVVIINPFPSSIRSKFIYEFGIPPEKLIVDKCYIDEKYDFEKWRRT